ncbi:putative copper amine oxidase [Hypoxylon crocopeplum]|nr:putative copper amine oxidase [Hypoxylon crocopeplum]
MVRERLPVRSLHPLDPITPDEIRQTARLLKAHFPEDSLHFKSIALIEPPKSNLRAYLVSERGGREDLPQLDRCTEATFFLRGKEEFYFARLSLQQQTVTNIEPLPAGFFPNGDADEVRSMRETCLNHPAVQAELKKLKLPEGTHVVCTTWPFGRDDGEKMKRTIQCYLFCRDPRKPDTEEANFYDFPLPLAPVFDYATKDIIEMIYLPTGLQPAPNPNPVYVPHDAREFHQDLQEGPLRSDLKPLVVSQPEGASFTVTGQLVQWQKWSFRVGFNWREGLVLYDIVYDGRELFHRLSLSEMVMPYADPRKPFHRKSVFDFGDAGAGTAANDLRLGCDCLGLIKYFSFVVTDSNGNPVPKHNAICMHEIDDGIGWKHTNTRNGLVSITRSRVLVLQTIITVGNYDYLFAWHFDQAAAVHLEIRATGILSTQPIDKNTQVPWGTVVNDGVMAPYHQHVFALRIDPNLDGPSNTLVEEDTVPLPLSNDLNPYGVGFVTVQNPLKKSCYSDSAPNRVHKIVNPNSINPITSRPVGYQIVSPVRQMLLAHPTSWHARRSQYAKHAYWVTRYHEEELHVAGRFTNQSLPPAPGTATEPGDLAGNVASWAAHNEDVEGQDIVVWHSICLTHNSRIEDYPVMPVDKMTVTLKPSGFFQCNPALDVPQSSQGTNKSVLCEGGGGEDKSCCGNGDVAVDVLLSDQMAEARFDIE